MTFRYSGSRRERDFNVDARPDITFTAYESNESQGLTDYLNSPNRQKTIYLLNPAYNFDPFKYIQRPFNIISNKGSYKFNLDFLKNSSSIIKKVIEKNPNLTEYHLNTNDEENIMKKIEQLYFGQKIVITEREAYLFKLITTELDIYNNIKRSSSVHERNQANNTYQIVLSNFYSYLKEMPKTFTITTRSKEYQCNIIGIHSSKVIHELLLKNPNLDHYEYDFDDEFGEFKSFCDILNFNFVKITTDNVYSLKVFAEDLQIDFILDDLNAFIDDYETRIQAIDDQQTLIDSIEELFDILYKIKVLTVKTVGDKILESSWSDTDEKVQELAAFILQVVQTDTSLHSYMVDLIEYLSKEANETNKLEILMPFITMKMMTLIKKNKQICLFIYMMHKRGFIQKEDIIDQLKKITSNNDRMSIFIVFLPELYEMFNNNMNKLLDFFHNNYSRFIQLYFPDNIDKFIKMRESGEPDDQLTKALRNDDVDTLQKIVSTNQVDLSEAVVPYNIYDDFDVNSLQSYINYASYYGSLKCFKYLILNHAKLNDSSFSCAVFGGNNEIVKIVDQQINEIRNSKDTNSNNQRPNRNSRANRIPRDIGSNLDNLIPSIKKHQNGLFDWIFEQKFSNCVQSKDSTIRLLTVSSENGNPHSITAIVDRGFDFLGLDRDICRRIIQNASRNGFYKLLQFLSILMSKNLERNNMAGVFDYESSVFFGNLSIFKFYLQKSQLSINNALSAAADRESYSIIEYIFENESVRNRIDFNSNILYTILSYSIKLKSNCLFEYLLGQIQKIQQGKFNNITNYRDLLSQACYLNKIDIAKKITQIILEANKENKITFSLPFYNAAVSGSTEICHFLIEQKVTIDFALISLQYQRLANINKDILDIIIENMTPDSKIIFLNAYMKEAITNKNKQLIEYLLKENAPCDSFLFTAVKTGDLDIVNMLLEYNSDPSFVNQISDRGTALNLAVTSGNLPIVQRLLAIPGIDPSLYSKSNTTPFVSAVVNLRIDMVNEILNFYGPNIKYQVWQLNEAVERFLNKLSQRREGRDNTAYLTVLNRLLEIEYIDLNLHAERYTLFSYACEANEIDIVKMLMKLDKVDINSYAPTNGNSPLMIAIENKNIEIAKLLLESDRTDVNQRNYDSDTALTTSVRKKCIEIIDDIINNKKFDSVKSRLDYAFYLATDEIAVKLIKAKDLDVNYKRLLSPDSESRRPNSFINFNYTSALKLFVTPLLSAVKSSKSQLVDLIINHPSFDPHQSFVRESMFVICRNSNISPEIFTSLIKFVDNDVNLKDDLNSSLLEIAVKNGNKNIVTLILNNERFDSKSSNLVKAFVSSFSRDTPFMDIMKNIFEFDKNHEKLIDFKNLSASGESYFTLISTDRDNHSISELVEFFLENGADPNMTNARNVYPLEYAMKMNNSEFVSALIESGKIDFSVTMKPKRTIKGFQLVNLKENYLHIAARCDDVSIISMLINNKYIDINSVDSAGETPLMKACKSKNNACISVLFKEDDLDYLKCNNNGEDALKIAIKASKLTDMKFQKIESKSDYRQLIMCLLSNSRIPPNLTQYIDKSEEKNADKEKDETEKNEIEITKTSNEIKKDENEAKPAVNDNEVKVTDAESKENDIDSKDADEDEDKIKEDESKEEDHAVAENESEENADENKENENENEDKTAENKENENENDDNATNSKESENKSESEKAKLPVKLAESGKDKEKVAPTKKFSFSKKKTDQSAGKKPLLAAAKQDQQKGDKPTKFAIHKADQGNGASNIKFLNQKADQKSDASNKKPIAKFAQKGESKFSFKQAAKSDAKVSLMTRNAVLSGNLQSEIMAAISKSLTNATPEQLQEISKNVSAVLDKEIKKTNQPSSNEQNQPKETE